MNLDISAEHINTFKVWNTVGKFCQIFKMSNIWANRKILFPKVKVLILFNCVQFLKGSCRSNLDSEKQFQEAEGAFKI